MAFKTNNDQQNQDNTAASMSAEDLRENRLFIERILRTGTPQEVRILREALNDPLLHPDVAEIIRDVWSKLDCIASTSTKDYFTGRVAKIMYDDNLSRYRVY